MSDYRYSSDGLPTASTRLTTPPWHLASSMPSMASSMAKPVNTDTALTHLVDKKTSTTINMKQDALLHIERYKDSNKIYTDAAKST